MNSGDLLHGPYWINTSTAVVVFVDSNSDLIFARTTDEGTNWSSTTIDTGVVKSVDAWFDKETPNDAGTLVHIAWLDTVSGEAKYRTVDVSNGNLGTLRIVSAATIDADIDDNRVAITKSRNGNLYVGFYCNSADNKDFRRSVDSGVNWTSRAGLYEVAAADTADWALAYPANTGDNADVAAIYWDISASQLSIKMYDDSLNSWTETVIESSVPGNSTYKNIDGAMRVSDGHILIAYHSAVDSSLDDLRTRDITPDSIASPTITSKTNIFTDQAASAQVALFINQQNNDVYVAYFKGGNWLVSVDLVYHKSTNGMTAWGSEQSYSVGTDDYRLVSSGRTATSSGSRFMPSFYDDDEVDILVSEANDVLILEEVIGTLSSTLGIATLSGTGTVGAEATGDLNVTLGAVAISAAGIVDVVGTVSSTLDALALAGSAVVDVFGTSTVTLGALTVSGVAAVSVFGTLSTTLDAVTLSGAGVADAGGSLAVTLGAVSLSATATLSGPQGDLSVTLGAITLSGTAAVGIFGTSTVTLGAAILSGTGTVGSAEITGDLNVALGALTLSGVGVVDIFGTATSTLGALTLSGIAAAGVQGTLITTLGEASISGVGVVGVAGTLSSTLSALTLSSVATVDILGTLSTALDTSTLVGVGVADVFGTAAPTFGAITLSGLGKTDVFGTFNIILSAVTLIANQILSGPGIVVATEPILVYTLAGNAEPASTITSNATLLTELVGSANVLRED